MRLVENIVGGGHEVKHEIDTENSDHREDNAHRKSRGDGCLDGDVKALIVSGTEGVADDDAGADGKTIEEENGDIDDECCRTDGGQGLRANKISDNDGIDCVVEHLENISEHQGECKSENLL